MAQTCSRLSIELDNLYDWKNDDLIINATKRLNDGMLEMVSKYVAKLNAQLDNSWGNLMPLTVYIEIQIEGG